MAADIKQQGYITIVSAMTTDLNSITNNSYATSAALGADAGDAELLADFELALATLTPTGTPVIDLWLIRSADGTNYEDSATPPMDAYVGSFEVTTGAGAKRAILRDRALPPGLFKTVIRNRTGVTFNASGNTLKYRPHSLQTV